MKVLFLIDGMEAITAGGSERQILQLIRFLIDARESVELGIFRETRWLTEDEVGCQVTFWDISRLFSFTGMLQLWKLFRRMRSRKFDAVVTMFKEANLIGPVLARLAGAPVAIGSRRNLNYWMSPGIARLQRVSNLFATRLLANCEAVKNVVSAMEHVSPAKVDVLYNGIDTSRFRPNNEDRKRIRQQLGMGQDKILIGNVSTFRPVKGLDLFVEAAVTVAKQSPNTFFLLVGDGPERIPIEGMIAGSGFQSRFVLVGSQTDVVPFLNALDIAVLSSHSEGFSNSILEYMAVGLPCVATDVGGNSEALDGTGITTPPKNAAALSDAILRLVGNAELRKRFASAALQRVRATFALCDAQQRFHSYLLGLVPEKKNT